MRYISAIIGCNAIIGVGSSAFQVYISSTSSKLSKAKFVAKENDVEIQIPKKLDSLINTVMDEMKLKKEYKELVKPYLCTGLNLIHYGHVRLTDTYIGFPQNFTVDEKINVNLTAVVGDLHLSADSPECQTLKSSLLLSEKAKKFAIAESIYETTDQGFITKLFIPTFCAAIINTIIYFSRLKKVQKSMKQFYFYVTILAVSLYLFLNDFMNIYIQLYSDFLAANLGKSYIEGGLEYYEKIIERNKTIKKLNKNAQFTDEGESNKFSLEANLKYKTRHEFLSRFENSKNYSLYRSVFIAMFNMY